MTPYKERFCQTTQSRIALLHNLQQEFLGGRRVAAADRATLELVLIMAGALGALAVQFSELATHNYPTTEYCFYCSSHGPCDIRHVIPTMIARTCLAQQQEIVQTSISSERCQFNYRQAKRR